MTEVGTGVELKPALVVLEVGGDDDVDVGTPVGVAVAHAEYDA